MLRSSSRVARSLWFVLQVTEHGLLVIQTWKVQIWRSIFELTLRDKLALLLISLSLFHGCLTHELNGATLTFKLVLTAFLNLHVLLDDWQIILWLHMSGARWARFHRGLLMRRKGSNVSWLGERAFWCCSTCPVVGGACHGALSCAARQDLVWRLGRHDIRLRKIFLLLISWALNLFIEWFQLVYLWVGCIGRLLLKPHCYLWRRLSFLGLLARYVFEVKQAFFLQLF